MKKITLFIYIIIFFVFTSIQAQDFHEDLSKLKIDKESTVSIILSNNDIVNNQIKKSIESNWNICKYEYITLDDIRLKSKKLSKYYLVVLKTLKQDSRGGAYIYAELIFGETNQDTDLDNAIQKFIKSKNESDLLIHIGNKIVSVDLDPSLIDINYSGVSKTSYLISKDAYKPNDLATILSINIKTIVWMLKQDLSKYINSKELPFVSNSCELKNMTLIIPSSYSKKGSNLDMLVKNFEIDEFKKYYTYKTTIVNDDKIKDLINSNPTNNYAILVECFTGNSPKNTIFRLNDGAILWQSMHSSSLVYGFSKKMYKNFETICN